MSDSDSGSLASSPIQPLNLPSIMPRRLLSTRGLNVHAAAQTAGSQLQVPATMFPKFMSIASEIRIKICKFILPCNQRLILDPQNIVHPSCFVKEEYGETLALLQTCRQVRGEALPLLYSRNTITIINGTAMADVTDPLETALGSTAYNEIKSIELSISKGVEELGALWSDIVYLPKLEDLKLVFYHTDGLTWMKQMNDLTAAMTYETPPMDHQSTPIEVRVELFESVAVPHYVASKYTQKMDEYMSRARIRAHAYRFVLPKSLKSITISASVSTHAAFAFATYRHNGWRFNSPPGPSTDNQHRKTLMWEKEHKELQDTVL